MKMSFRPKVELCWLYEAQYVKILPHLKVN
jgi:hypothetical protein